MEKIKILESQRLFLLKRKEEADKMVSETLILIAKEQGISKEELGIKWKLDRNAEYFERIEPTKKEKK